MAGDLPVAAQGSRGHVERTGEDGRLVQEPSGAEMLDEGEGVCVP